MGVLLGQKTYLGLDLHIVVPPPSGFPSLRAAQQDAESHVGSEN